MKALIVDPSTTVRTILRTHLKHLDVDVIMESSGTEAYKHIDAETGIDIICISMYLDDMQGNEFAELVRRHRLYDNTPIIMVTTEENREILASALKSGITEIFRKEDLIKMGQYLSALVERKQVFKLQGHVLCIDANPASGNMARESLEQLGLKVSLYDNADKALKKLKSEDFDLVMTNVYPEPNLSGISVVRSIRERKDDLRHTPILVFSDRDDHANKLESLQCGANDFIIKPILQEELRARVSNLIRNKKLFDKVREQQERLMQLAMTDQLTGLSNRHYLFETAPKRISEAIRHNTPISLIVIDLDKFKLINDTHGHTTGDIVLAETGKLIKSLCRNEDICARFGGEEFILLLSHCDIDSAQQKAEQIRSAIEQLKPQQLKISASLGVSTLPEGSLYEFRDLFAAADEAAYHAKENGRNQVVTKLLA